MNSSLFEQKKLQLATALLQQVKNKKWSIATAESCTGGLLASTISSISGSSEIFGTGIVSYSNFAKIKILGVKKQSLAKFGAVSETIALQMAKGVQKLANSEIAISTTGIAGPTGEGHKPIGLIYLGFAINDVVFCKKIELKGNRIEIQNQTVIFALQTIVSHLKMLIND